MDSTTTQISCKINTTDASARLGLEILLDGVTIFNCEHIQELINFTHDMVDTDDKHQIEFIMKNKTSADTRIDENGNIVKDSVLTLSEVKFDGIELNQIFIDQAVYKHNFNGTGPEILDKFYGQMGCNGTLALEFTTPIYIWLLENM